MSIDGVTNSTTTAGTTSATGQFDVQQMQQLLTTALQSFAAASGTVMDSTSGTDSTGATSSSVSDVPDLEEPLTTYSGFSGLSLESLVTAIGNTERKQACAEGVDRLENRAEKISETNQLKLDEMAKNLETAKKESKLEPFKKAFQWLGAIVGVVASAVTIGIGFATGNPLLMAAGGIGLLMAADGVASLASDGKVSISAGITWVAEACGASEETAQWIAFGVQMALTITAVCLSFSAAAKSLGSGAAKLGTAALNNINKAQSYLQILSGVTTAGQGATQIASTTFEYQKAMSEAEIVDLQAVLERISMAQEFEEAMIQAEMERSNDLLESVNDIISESNATAMTIMSSAPTMA